MHTIPTLHIRLRERDRGYEEERVNKKKRIQEMQTRLETTRKIFTRFHKHLKQRKRQLEYGWEEKYEGKFSRNYTEIDDRRKLMCWPKLPAKDLRTG
jgi:hypothetical protein